MEWDEKGFCYLDFLFWEKKRSCTDRYIVLLLT